MGSMKNICPAAAVCLLVVVVAGTSAFGRADAGYDSMKEFENNMSAITVAHCVANHDIGQIVLSVNNNGTFGTGFRVAPADCFTGGPAISCEYPKGSFYVYANVSRWGRSGLDFAKQLAKEAKVLGYPGTAFSEKGGGRNYIRFAYTRPVEELKAALGRIERMIGNS